MDEKQVGLVGQMTPAKEANFQKPLIAVYFEIDWRRNPKVLIYELPPDLICFLWRIYVIGLSCDLHLWQWHSLINMHQF